LVEEVLEMTERIGPLQSQRDRVLWILSEHGGQDGAEQIEETCGDEVCSLDTIREDQEPSQRFL
jgi:hypothetical protein